MSMPTSSLQHGCCGLPLLHPISERCLKRTGLMGQQLHSFDSWPMTPKHTALGGWEKQRNDSVYAHLASPCFASGQGLGWAVCLQSLHPAPKFKPGLTQVQPHKPTWRALHWANLADPQVKLIVQMFWAERHLFSFLFFLLPSPRHARI